MVPMDAKVSYICDVQDFVLFLCPFDCNAQDTPVDSEKVWTVEFLLKTVFLKLQK